MGLGRRGIAVFVAAVAALGLGSGSASAASVQWATDPFPEVCASPVDPACDAGAGDGYIKWGNRTAGIKGYVWDFDEDPADYTKVYFDAFAGSTKVDSDFRTANGQYRPFGEFPIGDPNLVGGIDRVRIQVCSHFPLWPYKECSAPVNVLRN
ncbi:hypothetical protein [Tenggerimyces flavus]|uniref:Secreted protein n=1 Tax=Tenggerimyces flavus TaxID=1708749 RepID=A0ABV7YHL1_9ACTN|nr:hypothetical protein [Tenggerimyces flavus]MBM7787968.1 hypothetical protein [Tenggerimyces flavus]